MAQTVWLGKHRRSQHQLSIEFGVDDYRFFTTYWYGDCDLYLLEEQYGMDFMENIYFHIVAYEANKACSLMPQQFDLGSYQRFYTPEFEKVWKQIFKGVWAQWRYENDQPNYAGPEIIKPSNSAKQYAPVNVTYGDTTALTFCGGGKDSLLALNLLKTANISYSSLAYSASIYGTQAQQHQLIDQLLDTHMPQHRHKMYVFDDLMDAPIVELDGQQLGIKSLTAAETPSSIFAALPLMLQHGYQYMVLAHERSANVGNLIWDKTGEDVNHQWGKSYEAEKLLNNYIQTALIKNIAYFSVLQPIYDVLIFAGLQKQQTTIAQTHSCNVSKPWCKRCPKCCYVWLNYMAYLDTDKVSAIFQENLFDIEENQLYFRQMLGLEKHTPFECIGQVDEARLAFSLCHRKGLTGKAMDMFLNEVPQMNWLDIAEKYLDVDFNAASLPDEYKAHLQPLLCDIQHQAREYLQDYLS